MVDSPSDAEHPPPEQDPAAEWNPSAPVPVSAEAARDDTRGGKWQTLIVIALAAAAIDQGTKHWANTVLRTEPAGRISVVDGYVALTYVRNPGAAWGFLSRQPASFRKPFFLSVSLIAMAFVLYLFSRLARDQRWLMVALALVLGGAVGNFIDRLRFGFVIDFLDFHVGSVYRWPTFNAADVWITCGVAMLFIEMFLSRKGARHKPPAGPNAGPPVPPADLS